MNRPGLAGIHHVKIPVTDLSRSRDWYARVFGFVPTTPTAWSAAWSAPCPA